ncbi:MAG: hypothetical protein PHD76_08310 [Methylacidiphilales bacterium]|nr:hypothetical protein [Candidatus Methylacidiphilales bacterium]
MNTQMDLRTFVKTTLVEIAVGVKEANAEIHEKHGGKYSQAPYRIHKNIGGSKDIPGISFDVAVIVGSGSTDKAGAGISVAQVFGIGGSVESTANDSYAHRIKFSVGLHTDWD